jgi:hypothetical protein
MLLVSLHLLLQRLLFETLVFESYSARVGLFVCKLWTVGVDFDCDIANERRGILWLGLGIGLSRLR